MVDVKQIEELLHYHFKIKVTPQIDPITGVVDIQGNVIARGLPSGPTHLPVQFGTVSDDFICINMGITTLKGAPHHVGGIFDCSHNKLINLTHAPQHVGQDVLCNNNQLTSLVGAPKKVQGAFYCYLNKLTSLVGAPHSVDGTFFCMENPLKSLHGAPEHMGGEFSLTYSKDLPLLRLCMYENFFIYDVPAIVRKILDKYKSQGKPAALQAAIELIRAGYRENARW